MPRRSARPPRGWGPKAAGRRYSYGVTDDRQQAVRADAQAESAEEGGWEPTDWSACLRRARRKQLALVGGMVLLFWVVSPVHQLTVDDRPLGLMHWVWAFLGLLYVVEMVISFVSETDRLRWEQETRQAVRITHALRHHTSIGFADRALVTDRAKAMALWARVGFVGWPLLGAFFIAGILDDHLPASLTVPVVLLCLLLVGRAVRKARLARRWLADPLPRGRAHVVDVTAGETLRSSASSSGVPVFIAGPVSAPPTSGCQKPNARGSRSSRGGRAARD